MNESESKLIVIGYSGGYGGNFLAYILDKALLHPKLHIFPKNKRNEFHYSDDSIILKRINLFFTMYNRGPPNVSLYDGNSETLDWYRLTAKFYESVYHQDRNQFVKNVVELCRDSLQFREGWNIHTAHYTRENRDFSLKMISENVIFFLLTAAEKKHSLLFEVLLSLKKNHFNNANFVSYFLKEGYNPRKVTPFDGCISLEVGQLFLRTSNINYSDAERILSETIKQKIILDKDEIEEYSISNVEMLNDFLGIDTEKSNYEEVLEATKTKLKSLL